MTADRLNDAPARDSILNDLDHNLVVEAAAGTGKTTSLVGRLMNLFRRGALAGDERLAAVTFTHKAAAELRERLERELARALALPAPEEERANLAAAAAALPECHIGTIHSFCARLLRERPVEAGVGPGFRELVDDDDLRYRRAAWAEFAAQLTGGDHDELFRVFEIFGLDLAALGQGFETFADYPDVARWPGDVDCLDAIRPVDFVASVKDWHAGLGDLPERVEGADPGNDELLPLLQLLNRRLPGFPDAPDIADAWRLCRLFRDIKAVKVRHWAKVLGLNSDQAKEIKAGYDTLCRDVVQPFRCDCLAAAYAAVLRAFNAARDCYDAMRRVDGVCNFQDLLLRTATLLRDHPNVRADLAQRYARLLVDEVQDTDPVQAEIMFFLAGENVDERDWRRCRPRPGALFIVGDPKQSIYRFRRADIVVYQEVKRLVVTSGGKVLGLTSNFRSQPSILDWVNRVFRHGPDVVLSPEAVAESGKFSADESPYSPAYVPLCAGRDAAGDKAFCGVYYLPIMTLKKNEPKSLAVRDEAARIARFIRHAVDQGMPIPAGGDVRPAKPADFMIVTYQKKAARRYAEAVRRLGLDCQVSGGATLAESPTLALLLTHLAALAAPDDAVALTAALRGGLWGVSDPDLYRWKKAGGAFSFLADAPEVASPVAAAMVTMDRHYRLFKRCEPVLAVERIVDDLGLWAHACLGDDPATSAGALSTALELLRADRDRLPTLGALLDRLRDLVATYDQDPPPAREKDGQAVRIMNLHKTKGLEAPIVFLTSTLTVRDHGCRFALRRDDDGAAAALAVTAGTFNSVCLARPAGWEEMAAEESLFLKAERTRLNYVAATRAGAALVVSVHGQPGARKSAFLPEFIEGETIEHALPEPEGEAADNRDGVLESLDAAALDAAAATRQIRREALLVPSYGAARATREAGGATSSAGAMEIGQAVHALLEANVDGDAATRFAAGLLAEYDLPATLADDLISMAAAVRRSAIHRRAEAADAVFREAPFTIRRDDGTLERGVVDLAFREAGGWVIVDYKSDRVSGDMNEAAMRHAGQLAAYARAWQAATGEAVRETGIYFLRADEYVIIPACP